MRRLADRDHRVSLLAQQHPPTVPAISTDDETPEASRLRSERPPSGRHLPTHRADYDIGNHCSVCFKSGTTAPGRRNVAAMQKHVAGLGVLSELVQRDNANIGEPRARNP